MVYSQSINEFIRKIFIANNSGISGTRPIILYYMIASIFKDEIKNNFDSFWQNRIFDNIINNNFTDFNCIIPMNNPKVHEGISKGLLDFKNNYKGPFVDNFYFMTLTVSACPECNNIFGVRTQISPFLQLDVTNSQNSISQIINNYFCSKIGVGNYVCNNCGFKGKKIRKAYCLNLPNYLVLEFEDKNALNFNDNYAYSTKKMNTIEANDINSRKKKRFMESNEKNNGSFLNSNSPYVTKRPAKQSTSYRKKYLGSNSLNNKNSLKFNDN
jgi:hypothetical protein